MLMVEDKSVNILCLRAFGHYHTINKKVVQNTVYGMGDPLIALHEIKPSDEQPDM